MSSELSYIDKKVIREAADFIELENKEVEKFMEEFSEKGSWGLWMDAKGFQNSSDKGTVLNEMESYSVLHEKILECFEAVEGNDRNAYQLIIALYEKIEELEREADIHADGESKALCQLAKHFLDNKWKLDHNVKRVQCVVLTKELNKTREFADTLNQRLEKAIDSFNSLQTDNRVLHEDNQKLQDGNQKLHEDNQKLQEVSEKLHEDNRKLQDGNEKLHEDNQKLQDGSENLQKSVDDLHEENLELKESMRKILHENQSLKDMISDANERADQRLKEVMVENRRSMQRMLIELREAKTESV